MSQLLVDLENPVIHSNLREIAGVDDEIRALVQWDCIAKTVQIGWTHFPQRRQESYIHGGIG